MRDAPTIALLGLLLVASLYGNFYFIDRWLNAQEYIAKSCELSGGKVRVWINNEPFICWRVGKVEPLSEQ